MVLWPSEADNPVQDIEGAVGAKCNEVKGVNDGGDRGLAEEEELRKYADRFEDDGEDPEDLDRSS